jgi:hypothetical protein
MPRAQVTAENSQRIFSTAPHHAPCHVSRGLARGRSAAKIALGGSGHHRGVCQLADFVSALPRYTVGPGKTVNLFHTVIHGSSRPPGSDWSKRLVATAAYATVLFTRMRGEENVERSHFGSDRAACRVAHPPLRAPEPPWGTHVSSCRRRAEQRGRSRQSNCRFHLCEPATRGFWAPTFRARPASSCPGRISFVCGDVWGGRRKRLRLIRARNVTIDADPPGIPRRSAPVTHRSNEDDSCGARHRFE